MLVLVAPWTPSSRWSRRLREASFPRQAAIFGKPKHRSLQCVHDSPTEVHDLIGHNRAGASGRPNVKNIALTFRCACEPSRTRRTDPKMDQLRNQRGSRTLHRSTSCAMLPHSSIPVSLPSNRRRISRLRRLATLGSPRTSPRRSAMDMDEHCCPRDTSGQQPI